MAVQLKQRITAAEFDEFALLLGFALPMRDIFPA